MHHIKPEVTSQTGKRRRGKGFSPDEIKEAGLDAGSARRLGIPVDWKRKSSHEQNVEALKSHVEKKPAAKPKANHAERKKKSKN